MKEMLFKEWAAIWVKEKRNYIKESTYANYVVVLDNHLIMRLGEYKVSDITKDIVQKMIIEMRDKGRRDKRGGLSDKTVKDIIAILKMCLRDYGRNDGWIYGKNALQYPLNCNATQIRIMDEDMYRKMLSAINREHSFEAMGYAVSLYTGMRIGEICALQWKDIDLKKKVIYVSKTLQRIYLKEGNRGITKIIIGAPKSKSAVREIPIAKALENLLKGGVRGEECYILSGTTEYVEPRLYRQHFMNFLCRNKLDYMRFHDLRHTFATRCIERGGDYKTVSCILGHSSVNMTLNRYVHPQLEQKRKCVDLI